MPSIKSFLEAAQSLDLEKLKQEKYLVTDRYFFTYKTIKGVEGDTLGMHLLASPTKTLQKAIDNGQRSFFTIAFIIFISLIVILSALILLRNK
ncbi:hypothetical protein JHD50_03185 [Sulfurimonas sp. MAG313]|nr:hypothetical protein [Sulfurimonas sp. MAG313]MDF1880316.1 hypothetical protein [Sulfurimonas sp. MAG313]